MFVFANLLNAIAFLLDSLLTIYTYVIIARAIISWVNPDPYNPLVNFLHRVTEPVLAPIRRSLPDLGGLDISPILVFLAILFAQKFLVRSLFDLAASLSTGLGG
jgi:YggT family protein